MAVMMAGAPTSADATPTTPALAATTREQTQKILDELMEKSSSSDPRYLDDKVWVDGSPTCFRCTLGPAVLAAARGTDPAKIDTKMINVSVATFDRAIKGHQRSDGAIVPAGPGEGNPSIQTVMFANSMAWTYLLLGKRLDTAHRVQWKKSLAKSADYLIRNGELTWYTNGNINLALTMNMDLTYKITKQKRFKTATAKSYAFLVNPPQNKFSGFGLTYTKKPKKADGSDGAAYFAEAGGGRAPGYDPGYSTFQADMASVWYYLTSSPTALRLTNLIYNQLTPRVRTSDWTIDVGGGSRQTAAGVRYAFTTSALPVLALKGGRTDLKPLVESHTIAALKTNLNNTSQVSPGASYSYGIEMATTYSVITTTK